MKLTKTLLTLSFFLTYSFSVYCLPTTNVVQKDRIEPSAIASKANIKTVDEFMALTPSKYKELSGEKLSVKETIQLKSQQMKLKYLSNSISADGLSKKSQGIALLLVIFVGVLGIHRFYLNRPISGILMILTLGGCGIWAFIDLILILVGSLKPKHSDYDTTLFD